MKSNFKFSLNYVKDSKDKRDFIFKTTSRKLTSVPTIVDHTLAMTSIKDQGTLGSCVAFAVSAMKEWQESREHLLEVKAGKKDFRKGKEYNYSESWIYWNAKKIDPWPNEEGTSIRFAMKVLHKIGVPCESAWPYSDTNIGKPESWASLVARWSVIDSYWRINNLNELKVALLNGPVVIGIPCFDTIFYADETGLVAYPRDPDTIYGGHAVCVVGYNDKSFGGSVKFKNSWGKYWGDRGYGYLPYKYITDFLWDAWACKDLTVTKDMLKGKKVLFD